MEESGATPCLSFFLNLVNFVNPVEDISMPTLETGSQSLLRTVGTRSIGRSLTRLRNLRSCLLAIIQMHELRRVSSFQGRVPNGVYVTGAKLSIRKVNGPRVHRHGNVINVFVVCV